MSAAAWLGLGTTGQSLGFDPEQLLVEAKRALARGPGLDDVLGLALSAERYVHDRELASQLGVYLDLWRGLPANTPADAPETGALLESATRLAEARAQLVALRRDAKAPLDGHTLFDQMQARAQWRTQRGGFAEHGAISLRQEVEERHRAEQADRVRRAEAGVAALEAELENKLTAVFRVARAR